MLIQLTCGTFCWFCVLWNTGKPIQFLIAYTFSSTCWEASLWQFVSLHVVRHGLSYGTSTGLPRIFYGPSTLQAIPPRRFLGLHGSSMEASRYVMSPRGSSWHPMCVNARPCAFMGFCGAFVTFPWTIRSGSRLNPKFIPRRMSTPFFRFRPWNLHTMCPCKGLTQCVSFFFFMVFRQLIFFGK